jgi:hypothetical protein
LQGIMQPGILRGHPRMRPQPQASGQRCKTQFRSTELRFWPLTDAMIPV